MIRVLIVDDEQLIRSSLAKKIEEYGNGAVVAATLPTGVIATKWLETYYADICLTDIYMPGMDGLKLIDNVKETHPWMKCIVVSGYDEFEYARKSLSMGVVDYILKPIDREVLGRVLDRTLTELREGRRSSALTMIMNNLHECNALLESWAAALHTLRRNTVAALADETLTLMERIADAQAFYLEPEMAEVWLRLVQEKLDEGGLLAVEKRSPGDSATPALLEGAAAAECFRERARRILIDQSLLLCDAIAAHRESRDRNVIEAVKRFIDENCCERISLQDIADGVFLSKNYLAALFKSETGSTVWSYLTRVRMERAKELLAATDLKAYEIADKVGYKNSIHFAQRFKEYCGLNPTEYKKRIGR
jgi:two-component system response regulator YesN